MEDKQILLISLIPAFLGYMAASIFIQDSLISGAARIFYAAGAYLASILILASYRYIKTKLD